MGLYDLMGRKVINLLKDYQQAGSHEVEWCAEGIKPGVYFYILKAGEIRKTNKMILLE